MTQVVLVRHGATEWSRTGRHTGRTDVPLEEPGRDAARRLGPALAAWTFVSTVTSPLSRAAETAALAGFGGATRDPRLQEWHYGTAEGRTTVDMRATDPSWSVWTSPMVEGETIEEVAARVDEVVEELRQAAGPVLVFAHGHLLRILAARWLGLDAHWGRALLLDPATISLLGTDRGTAVIERWNAPISAP